MITCYDDGRIMARESRQMYHLLKTQRICSTSTHAEAADVTESHAGTIGTKCLGVCHFPLNFLTRQNWPKLNRSLNRSLQVLFGRLPEFSCIYRIAAVGKVTKIFPVINAIQNIFREKLFS